MARLFLLVRLDNGARLLSNRQKQARWRRHFTLVLPMPAVWTVLRPALLMIRVLSFYRKSIVGRNGAQCAGISWVGGCREDSLIERPNRTNDWHFTAMYLQSISYILQPICTSNKLQLFQKLTTTKSRINI